MTAINEYKQILLKLDGKQSVSIPINIKKNGRHLDVPVDVILRGFLKFKDTTDQLVEDKTVIYPVLFSTNRIRVNDGRCVLVLLPRSEDLFETTEQLQLGIDDAVLDGDIVSQNNSVANDPNIAGDEIIYKEGIVIIIEKDKIRYPYKLSIEVTVISKDGSVYVQTIDRGTKPTVEVDKPITSLFQKTTKRIPSNMVVEAYSDLEWIPSVKAILGNNDSSKDDILDEIVKLNNNTPLGTSTMYDAVVSSARILSNTSVDSDGKIIYLFTDNEANISVASLDNAIEEVNDIDGDKQVPILVGNMVISDDTILSIKANKSDTKNINKLSFLTGGQAITVVDENYLDDIVGIFYRSAVGSMGYGTYEFIKDFGEEVLINNISAIFEIPSSDSNATWTIETSLDGYNYTPVSISYSYSDSVDFESLLLRYVRFYIVFVTGISSSGSSLEAPSLTSITIIYNANKVAYLYLNKNDVDIQPYQIDLAVDANEINTDQIKVGVAKSNSSNWEDYSTDSQPTVNQNGKVIVPIRFSQDITSFPQEPLERVDNFITKTEYGTWDKFATVLVYDKLDRIIPTSNYNLYPREGKVVFNNALPSDYQNGDYKIGIINSTEYKIGLKLTNKTETTTLDIFGIGHMQTTGKNLLPPVSKAKPEVRQVEILNEAPKRFDIIEVSYIYFDTNFDVEDTSQRVIKWFINGDRIRHLDNLTKWNDITNIKDPVYSATNLSYPSEDDLRGISIEDWAKQQTESLIKSGDIIFFEIQVNDGILMGDPVKSTVSNVVETPPIITSLSIRADDGNGNISLRLASDTKAVIYPPLEESFFSDSGGVNQSEIIWQVNGAIFKRGIFGRTVPEGQPPIHEIWVNEIGTGNSVDYGLRIGSIVSVTVTPMTFNSVGETVTSTEVLVNNSLPRVYDVEYVTTVFKEDNDIILHWKFFDFEIDVIGDIDATSQEDKTMVQWYRKNDAVIGFELVYSFNDQDNSLEEKFYGTVNDPSGSYYEGFITTNIGLHTSAVDSGRLNVDQQWYCVLTPYDNINGDTGPFENGTPVTTNTVTITSATN